jgi:hypothetical protein
MLLLPQFLPRTHRFQFDTLARVTEILAELEPACNNSKLAFGRAMAMRWP